MNFLILDSLNEKESGTCRFINLDHIVEIILPNDCTGGSIKDIHGKMHILSPEQVSQLLTKLEQTIDYTKSQKTFGRLKKLQQKAVQNLTK